MRRTWVRLCAVPIALTLAAAACSTSDDDDDAGGTSIETPTDTEAATTEAPDATTADGTGTPDDTTEGTTAGTEATGSTEPLPPTPGAGSAGAVTVFGVEDSENEAGAMQDALTEFGEANGITITYVGRRDFEQQINSQVLGGNPPDIAAFPQPGKLIQFAEDGDLIEVQEEVQTAVSENWDESFLAFSNLDGTQYGVPFKNDLKSLVWYLPSVWEEKGYTVPETLTDFFALTDEMIANGDVPLCVGIESGAATGWPFTDWVEEILLREQGVEFYNQWVAHEIPFNDEAVVAAMERVNELWSTDGAVYASGGSIAATAFGDNGGPLVNGDCMMHRQANFFSAFFPDGTEFGEGPGQVSTFYFPSDEGHPVLVGGISAGAFRDAPEVWQVMEYLGSPEFANTRQTAQSERVGGGNSGFLTGNRNADPTNWNELEQSFLETLQTADPAAFDASDQMPADVGSGSFLSEVTAFVNGDQDAQTTADNIEASWP